MMDRNMAAGSEEWPTCRREEQAAAFRELIDALTAVGNYLAAANRLFERGSQLRLGEVLAKGLGQSERASEATRRLRKLLNRGRVPDDQSLSSLR
jgi:hypothetical protein